MSKKNIVLTLALIIVIAGTAASMSSRTERWTTSSLDDYQKGTLENLVISSTGELTLGPALTRIESKDLSIWCSAVDPKSKTIYFGTGNEGKLYSLSPDNKLSPIGETKELVVTALTMDADSTLYAATIPSGKIFTFKAGSEVKEFAAVKDKYIWSLAIAADGTLLAGTGPNGGVYKVSEGKAEVWYETKQSHVLSLATTPEGLTFAGTSPNGVLYQIAADGKGKVVFNTDEQEIRSLQWANESLWIGANRSKKFNPKTFVKRLKTAASKAQDGEDQESPFQELFDGTIYQLRLNTQARKVHSMEKTYLTSLTVDKNGSIFATTGDEGTVWQVESNGDHSMFAKVKESQIMTAALIDGTLAVIGTGNAGAIYRLDPSAERAGSFTSEIKDAKFPTTWGSIAWDATAKLNLQTRSGSTRNPDDNTWSPWSDAQTQSPAKITSPQGRYFQYRVSWKDNPEAALRWVTVIYRPQNQQPDLKSVEVDGFDDANAFQGKARENSDVSIRWKGSDPDGDTLRYRIFYQRAGKTTWVALFDEPTTKKAYTWKTDQVADGWYRVNVVAVDDITNPAGSTRSAEKVAGPFLVDNTRPTFGEIKRDGRTLTGSITDASSVIARIEIQVDGGESQFLLPKDGIYDERTESFSYTLPKNGDATTHHFSLRALDAGGNVAAYQDSYTTR